MSRLCQRPLQQQQHTRGSAMQSHSVLSQPQLRKQQTYDGRSRLEHRRFRETTGAKVVCCDVVKDYRAVAEQLCHSTDVVLEIGCCTGHTVAALAPHAQAVYGIDLSESELQLARETYPSLAHCFRHADALDIGAVRSLAKQIGVTVLLVDINGSRPLKTLLPLLDAYKAAIKPRLVIVKNHKLTSLLRSTELSHDLLAQGPEKDSCDGSSKGISSSDASCKALAAFSVVVAVVAVWTGLVRRKYS